MGLTVLKRQQLSACLTSHWSEKFVSLFTTKPAGLVVVSTTGCRVLLADSAEKPAATFTCQSGAPGEPGCQQSVGMSMMMMMIMTMTETYVCIFIGHDNKPLNIPNDKNKKQINK